MWRVVLLIRLTEGELSPAYRLITQSNGYHREQSRIMRIPLSKHLAIGSVLMWRSWARKCSHYDIYNYKHIMAGQDWLHWLDFHESSFIKDGYRIWERGKGGYC